MVASRGPVGSRVDGRGSWTVGRGLRVTVCGSVVRAPNSRRAERLLRGRLGGVARFPCRQRHSDHHRFRCVAPCRSTRIVQDRTKSCPCQLEDNAFRRSISCARARRVRACERCDFFLRARRDFLRANVNLERRSVFRATLNRAERLFVAQTFGPFRVVSGSSRVDGG